MSAKRKTRKTRVSPEGIKSGDRFPYFHQIQNQ